MDLWAEMIERFEQDDNMHLLVADENEMVISLHRSTGAIRFFWKRVQIWKAH